MTPTSCISPDWPAPHRIVAFSTTRDGGSSVGRFAGLNLGDHVGDDRARVTHNRNEFASRLPSGTAVQWLTQDHGTKVILSGDPELPLIADGAWTSASAVACTVMTADCLPVLFCARDGGVIGAAHAGWRGLCAGILEVCIEKMGVPAQSLLAWMGPAIGPTAFEVGAEVMQQFLDHNPNANRVSVLECFKPIPGLPSRFLADLYGLATLRMRSAGIVDIYGGNLCTYGDAQRFYSFRRDGQTGRMATTIVISP
jgi:YfiH family protein